MILKEIQSFKSIKELKDNYNDNPENIIQFNIE